MGELIKDNELESLRKQHQAAAAEAAQASLDIQIHKRKMGDAEKRYAEARAKRNALADRIAQIT